MIYKKPTYYAVLITFFIFTVIAPLTACEIRAKKAHPLIETCEEKFGEDHDKKYWCLGKCEKVSNYEYRSICENVKAKK